jgi:hypothetical protein
MRNSMLIKCLVQPRHVWGKEVSRRPQGNARLGLIGLLLVSLLVFTSTPVSASESTSKLFAGVPTLFYKTNPADSATGQTTNLTLDWGDSRWTEEYKYCIDTDLSVGHVGVCDASWISTGLNTFVDLTLSPGITYEWQVWAHNTKGDAYADSNAWFTFTTAVAPPGTFSKSLPTSGATSQAISSLTLSWAASSGATGYEYCYDSAIDNDCTSWSSTSNTSVVIGGLSNSTQYEWQVRAVNSNPTMTYADSGTWWHFTTIVAQPGSFSKSNPTAGATGQPINLTLSWEASSNATSYEYCYDSDLTDGHVGVCDTSWTTTDLLYANISDLAYEDVYEWQVRAVNANPTKTDANTIATPLGWWTFTTKANPVGLYKITPGNATTNQPTTLTIEWSSYGGATSYEYCVDPVLTGTLGACDTGWTNNLLVTFKEISLAYATEYEWQVRANDSFYTYADGDTWWTFTTVVSPPGSFNKIGPTNGLLNQELSLTLSWGASTGATSYRYCIDNSNNNICNTVWNSTDTISEDISGLNYDTQYYWQVRAYNDNPNYTNANSGSWYNFTTVVAPPGSFYKISPADGAVNRPINSLTLDWGTSSGADEYEYCIDTTADLECTSPAVWTSTDTNTQVTLNGLSYATEYEWQVRALNANEIWTDADNDVPWTLTTVVSAPGTFHKISPVHTASDLLPSSVTLQWGASDRATSYWYCVDSTLNSACDGSWVFNDVNLTAIPLDLAFNTTYEWQIRADNANPTKTYADGNTWWTFTTRVGTLPASFSKQFPLDFAEDQPTDPTLTWVSSTYASHYEYCYYDTAVASSCTSWLNNGASTQVTLSGLQLDHTYKWQVRAWNDTVGPTYSNSGAYWTFTTVLFDPPTPFGKTSPSSGATNLPLSLVLDWEDSTNVSIYQYCYDTLLDDSCSTDWVSTTDTSAVISNLAYGNHYEWQVRAFYNGNPNPTIADAGDWWIYTTTDTPPGNFNKSEPINHATDRPTTLTLSWGISSGIGVLYEYCYEVYDGNDTCEGSWTQTTENSAVISGLSNATTYSWQVRAINANPIKSYGNSGSWYQFTTIISPPSGFSKSSPVNGAVAQPLTVNLSWNPSSGATGYTYCYDSNVNAVCSGTWYATTATNAIISGLSYGTGYEWQVRASNLNGTIDANGGSLWGFMTLATPPGAFNKSNPAKGANGQSIGLTLSWGTSSGATGYEYCIDTTLDSTCEGDAWISTAGLTSANPPGLTYLTTYQWQVRAVNSNPNPTHANSGTWWIFTTVISPPGPFSKTSPAHDVSNQPSSQYLTWEASSGATSYVFCYDDTLDSTCGTAGNGTWTATNQLYANIPDLTFGATYEWQVQAVNVNGTTDANDNESPEWWTFTVKPLPAFSKVNPNHLAINQPIDLSITWTAAGDLTDEGYYYCLDDINTTNESCDTSWIQVSKTTTSVPISLANNTTYAWQVIAKTSAGDLYANAGETPEWWTFTTVEAYPGSFIKSGPSNEATIQPTNNLTLSWAASSNADGYRYCLDTNTGNTTCDTNWTTVGAGTTSVIISNLSYSTTYQWQVMASNNNPVMAEANDGESPEWWTFTTAMAPPEAFDKISPETNSIDLLPNLTLSWAPAIGTTSYKYCIDSNLDSGHVGVCDSSWISAGMNTSVQPAGLAFDTVYEWQVQAFSNNPHEPTGADGGIWFVLTTVVAPPGGFMKSSPDTGLSSQPVNLMLSWDASPRAAGYEYCIDRSIDNGCDGVWTSTTLTQAIISGLTNKTEYEWHVRAVNANPNITEADSGVWSTFSTIPLYVFVPVIERPRLAAPVLNPVTVGTPYSKTYTLSWNSIFGATKYLIWESLTTTFPTDHMYETSSTSFTLPTSPLNPTRYYYYVVATDYVKPSNPSNVVAVTRQYEFEDNGTSITANGPIFSGFTYYGQKNDLRDYFKIYLSGPGTITVTITNIQSTWPMQLQLFEEDTSHLRIADVTPGNGMSVTWTATKANWYYILIATAPTGWDNGWYNFTVTFTPTP